MTEVHIIQTYHLPRKAILELFPPADMEHRYRRRKQTHSLNVQVVCVSKYPGSAHDSFLLKNSPRFSNMSDGM